MLRFLRTYRLWMPANFSDRARDVLIRANAEARLTGHQTIRAEHVLLGLLSDKNGVAGRVLADFGLTLEPVRTVVRDRLGAGVEAMEQAQLPLSPEADALIEKAARLALAFGEPIGTEHLLLAVVLMSDNGAFQTLWALNVDPAVIRFAIKQEVWGGHDRALGRTAPQVKRRYSAPAALKRDLEND
jgi:ATP-dependent Clp protease ATP-binding subunit ClpC